MVQAAVRTDARDRLRPASSPRKIAASDVLVGGTNSAFALSLNGCIARGEGSRVWDDDGNEYVDCLLSSGPMILGHSHPRVRSAVADQISDGFAFNALNRPAIELAERIVTIPGCSELVRFASTGTEATMHALRLARAYTGRSKVLIFAGGYHGSHDVSIVGFRGPAMASTGGVPDGVIKDTALATFNDIESVEDAFATHGDEIAAVMMEPQQRAVDPSPGFLQAVVDTAHEHGAITIFDEVLTGFRLAYGGAQEYYGVQPDLLCYGKIVGGGFPLSAIAGKREIMRLADPKLAATPDFVHLSGTMSGNPVSAAAGLATLDELRQPGVYERLHASGNRLRTGLRSRMDALSVGGSVNGSGPIASVLFADSPEHGSGVLLRDALNRRMMRRGVLVQMQTRFYLSLAHTDDDVDFVVDAFGESLRVATTLREVSSEVVAS